MKEQEVKQAFQKLIEDKHEPITGVSTVVISNNKVVARFNAGYSYIEKQLPVTNDTYFRIASVSKLFTALGVIKLVEKKQMDLDKDISDYLGFRLRNPFFKDSEITSRMLLSHTSSINDNNGYFISFDKTIEDFMSEKSFNNNLPGSYFTYSNLNYLILGAMIENVSTKRFDIYMKEEILEPMNLKSSYNILDFKERISELGVLYRKKEEFYTPTKDDYNTHKMNEEKVLINYRLGVNPSFFGPQGSLRISSNELAEVMIMIMNKGVYQGKKIVSSTSLEMMFSPHWVYDDSSKNGELYENLILSYGLGTHQMTNTLYYDKLSRKKSLFYIGHHGDAYGLMSMFLFDWDKKEGIVNIINGLGFDSDNPRHFSDISVLRKPEQKIIDIIVENYLM